ncbi:ABC transporter permease [Ruminococcus sp. OA3]|uniref:ABC transporter permease n=1 Tax=Ruminococcus sp. OA3 TaxID=2914164 RepID=UPI0031F47B70
MTMNELREMSIGQKNYLKSKKRDRQVIQLVRILIFLVFLSLWEVSTRLGWIDSFIFSSPSRVLRTIVDMTLHQGLMLHIGTTLFETLVSFFFVTLLSIGVAVLLWISSRLSYILEPYLVILNSLPKSALAPLLIVWLGAKPTTIIVAGMSVAIFGAIINLYTGFQEVDKEKLKLIYTFGGTKKDALIKVVLPSSIPLILSVMKVNIGLCLVGIIIGEFISSKQGLGHLIIYGSQVFRLAGILILSAIHGISSSHVCPSLSRCVNIRPWSPSSFA